MDKARETRRPWRSWTVIALVLTALALAQACGESGSRTGPTSTSGLQLKLRRVGNAELPPGCTGGTYSVTGPGLNIQDAPLPPDGNISVPLTVGLTYTFSVKVNCPPFGILTGSTTIGPVPPGGASGQIVITVTRILGVGCDPSTVAPGEASKCTCNVQSLTGFNIEWKGVESSNGASATFRNQKPGVYTVSCTINGVDTRSTTVEVKSPEAPPQPLPPPPPPTATGTIQVVNTDCCTLFAKAFVQPADTQVGGELAVTQPSPGFLSVPPGNYIVRIACSSGGALFAPQGPLAVTAGNTTVFSYSGGSTCG